jgi:hypothetical protein
MDLHEIALRVWHDLFSRTDGPMSFRFIMQPTVATLLALRDGVRDGQTAGPTFLVALITGAKGRRALLRTAMQRIGRLLIVALTLDVIYQSLMFGKVYPGEAVLVSFIFGFLPYAISRGVVARFVRMKRGQ